MALVEASFANVSLGPVCTIETYPNEVARQINEYPGVNGLEVLTLGSRGGTSEAAGLLVADNEIDLATYFQVFRNLALDGGAYRLVDPQGMIWNDVILVRFRPDGPTKVDPVWGASRAYKAMFLHIDARISERLTGDQSA